MEIHCYIATLLHFPPNVCCIPCRTAGRSGTGQGLGVSLFELLSDFIELLSDFCELAAKIFLALCGFFKVPIVRWSAVPSCLCLFFIKTTLWKLIGSFQSVNFYATESAVPNKRAICSGVSLANLFRRLSIVFSGSAVLVPGLGTL